MDEATLTAEKLKTLREFYAYLQSNVCGLFGIVPGEGYECMPRGIAILKKLFQEFEKAVIAGNESEFVKNAPEEAFAPTLSSGDADEDWDRDDDE
jgi:hypothetical protein